jgi:predicted NBD/HSP70 family sugar kinase
LSPGSIVIARSYSVHGPVVDLCVVFDIGGTNIRAALYDGASRTVSRIARRPTPSHWSLPESERNDIRHRLFTDLREMASEVSAGEIPWVLSVAFPGPMNPDGRVLAAPTIWGPTEPDGFHLADALDRIWPKSRVLIQNDVSAAGYRYLHAADESFCIITVGSGVGNKLFLNGTPATGPHGRGGEIGHIRVDDAGDANICDCGSPGHLGAVASGRGALLSARRKAAREAARFSRSELGMRCGGDPKKLTNADIVGAFAAGDEWTRELIHQVSHPLGHVIATIHLACGVERFVIYGGFALALGPSYRECLVHSATQSTWGLGQNWDRMIELGAADDLSGLIGAGRYAVEFARDRA